MEPSNVQTMIDMNFNAAIQAASYGFHVVPWKVIKEKDAQGVESESKKPLFSGWQEKAYKSTLEVSSNWKRELNVMPGIRTGEGLLVVDCDTKHPGINGIENFNRICAERSIDLSSCPVVESCNGGLHFYFKTDRKFSCSVGKVGKGIDVRATGGFIAYPGSTLPDGKSYKLRSGSDMRNIPSLPDALADLLVEKRETAPPQAGESIQAAGPRNQTYAQGALDKAYETIRSAQPEERNSVLNSELFSLAQLYANGSLPDLDRVKEMTFRALEENGYIGEHGKESALATIESAWQAGVQHPRPLLPEWNEEENFGYESNDEIFKVEVTEEFRQAIKKMLRPLKTLRNEERIEEDIAILPDGWPKPLRQEAFIGPIGEYVRIVGPHFEGSESALVIALLNGLGMAIGRKVFITQGESKLFPNLYTVLVGESGIGRKSTCMNYVSNVVKAVDPFVIERIQYGLGSGEVIIALIRDRREFTDENGKAVCDEGSQDKRLWLCVEEFSQILSSMKIQGSVISNILRVGFDSKPISKPAKRNMDICREPHIAVLSSITPKELAIKLPIEEVFNGFANRFSWICSRSSKRLDFDQFAYDTRAVNEIIAKIQYCIHYAQTGERFLSNEAKEVHKYCRSEFDIRSGSELMDTLKARQNVNLLKYALIYSALEGASRIEERHMEAAYAVCEYAQASAEFIFGASSSGLLSPPGASQDRRGKILSHLESKPEGASSTEVYKLFANNDSKGIYKLLKELEASGKLRSETRKGKGPRPATFWILVK